MPAKDMPQAHHHAQQDRTAAPVAGGRRPALARVVRRAHMLPAMRWLRTTLRHDIRILAYHRVLEQAEPEGFRFDPALVSASAEAFRERGFPVVWTYVAYMESGEDCGVWGTRTNTPDSLQNIKVGSRRAEFDDRLDIDRQRDIIINKRMASAFFETNLGSIFTFHGVDTCVITGGSTSGCVRATVVDSLQRSFRTIVPEECVADKHESPHFANLYDMMLKYADVLSIDETLEQLGRVPAKGAQP